MSCTSGPRTRLPALGGAPLNPAVATGPRSEEHTSELQSRSDLVCRLLLEKKKKKTERTPPTHKKYLTRASNTSKRQSSSNNNTHIANISHHCGEQWHTDDHCR